MATMQQTQTIRVPHLDTQVGYAVSAGSISSKDGLIDGGKPTFVLINGLCATTAMYREQLASPPLAAAANLLAVEPLGHGATTCGAAEHFTYWDSAHVFLQAMTALGVDRAYVLGTSQGGWIAVRMALLAPERILGLITLGTSMDYESAESRQKGCWDPAAIVPSFLEKWTSSTPTPEFVVGDDWTQAVLGMAFGSAATPDLIEYWTDVLRRVYSGNEGRRKLRMSVICVADRDGLLSRLGDVKCPIHWLHGTTDPVFASTMAEEHIKLFTSSPSAKLSVLDSDAHFLNASHRKEVEEAMLAMLAES
ncbi:hypothetical protein AAE478_010352 [Parahypoxylon ruwenzoriense]